MLCALTVRQLKPGTFERFAEEFGPRSPKVRLGAGCGSVVVNGVFEVVRDMSVA